MFCFLFLSVRPATRIELRSRRRLSISTSGRRLLKRCADVFSNVVQTSSQTLCRRLLRRCADVSSVQCRDDVFSEVVSTFLQFNIGKTPSQTSCRRLFISNFKRRLLKRRVDTSSVQRRDNVFSNFL
ncbi:hypothetical protein IscW_ISCW002545 [Ixodes scapularis]|uniref:Uncharacterized protein n=1 Tax=Ixodes scapularis TaxID=6945 RepID=B7PCA9_IXOSC|nr:hypothetical protein IscW_ISCW002545 [Ixodes scapularis]|eukprot:XP_002409564.1 hypothetical protein IscW_ISCW002545 [Ixodes scapularis]